MYSRSLFEPVSRLLELAFQRQTIEKLLNEEETKYREG